LGKRFGTEFTSNLPSVIETAAGPGLPFLVVEMLGLHARVEPQWTTIAIQVWRKRLTVGGIAFCFQWREIERETVNPARKSFENALLRFQSGSPTLSTA
jgi:hypothetical protein